MTFTYDLTGGFTNLTRVRFRIGDKDSTAPIFQDEEINAVLSDYNGDWRKAAVALLQSLIATLAGTPNFTADWLKVDVNTAIANYMKSIAALNDEIEIASGVVETGSTNVYRLDSDQRGEPYVT